MTKGSRITDVRQTKRWRYNRKGCWRYGIVVAKIRRVASSGKPFTKRDIGYKGRPVAQSLSSLFRRGELLRVKKGRNGRKNHYPPVYKLNERNHAGKE